MSQFFAQMGINATEFLSAALILLVGTFVISLFGRFAFGKRSTLNSAVSSLIGILFIYAITVVLKSTGFKYDSLIAPLPFVDMQNSELTIFSFFAHDYTVICAELLSAVILSFLVNLADGWLPKGKSIFGWLFFRCLTVIIAYFLHLVVVGLFVNYMPEGIVIYAPAVLLGLLIVLLLTGALKIIVGALLATVNPIISGLYTFFFATAIGKQVFKAMLTTALLALLVLALNYAGIFSVSIVLAALSAYIPFLILLVVLWYIVYNLF